MTLNIHQLIAALNPSLFCQPLEDRDGRQVNLIKEVGQVAREKGYSAAAQIARPKETEPMDFGDAADWNPFSLRALQRPTERHVLDYDAMGESLAPLYFWLLHALPTVCPNLKQVEKLVDNLASAPGSGHFADLHRQMAQIQERVMKMLETSRRSIERITQDLAELKELQRRPPPQAEMESEDGEATRARMAEIRGRLKREVALANLYAKWLKPYLQSVSQLSPTGEASPALVAGLNTVQLEVVLLAEALYDPKEDVDAGRLPKGFLKLKRRQYFSVLVIELRFLGVPEHLRQGGYVYRGRTELTITSYGLNEEELRVLKKVVEQDSLGELMRAVTGQTEEELTAAQQELSRLLGEGDPASGETRATPTTEGDLNPFTALLSIFRHPFLGDGVDGSGSVLVRADSDVEKVMRSQASLYGRQQCRRLYENLKATKGLARSSDAWHV